MQPQPARLSPFREISSRTATQGYAKIPNSVVENLGMLTHAELAFLLIVCRRGENTVSDKHWNEWTNLGQTIKDNAIRGLKQKGLVVRGRGDRAKYYFERDKWDSWVRTRPRHERARTTGRSKSVTAKTGMQIHQECQARGCARLCDSQVIPFPATQLERPVVQTIPDPPPKEDISPPPKGGFPLTLKAVQKYFPHTDDAFVRKLCTAVEAKTKHYTDAQLAQVVHAAKKRNQESEGLFLLTVPARYAAGISTEWHLTDAQRRELRQAEAVLANPAEWPPDAIEQAKGILKRYS
jgi:hypothetical protein